MPRIRNTTKSPIYLPTGHKIPAGGRADVPEGVLKHTDNRDFLAGQFKAKKLERTKGASKVPAAVKKGPKEKKSGLHLSREDICTMMESNIREHLAEAGLSTDGHEGDLRARLADHLFEAK